MIVGGYEAVKIWATQRFDRIDHHVVHTIPRPGMGMHSEHFMSNSILPAILEETNATIITDPSICFWRVRADQSVWIGDCDKARAPKTAPIKLKKKEIIEEISGLNVKDRN